MNKDKYIVHLMNDDKFIDIAISLFEKTVAVHLYLVLLEKGKKKPTYVKSDKIKIVRNVTQAFAIINLFGSSIDGVIVHHYKTWKAKIFIRLKQQNKSMKLLWLPWGADFYERIHYPLYQKKTLSLLKQHKKENITSFLRGIKKKIKHEITKNYDAVAFSYFDFCAPVLDTEFPLLKKIPDFRAKQVSFSYGAIDNYIPVSFLNNKTSGNNILLGNSATFENNHLEALDTIFDILGTTFEGKIIAPLSYGQEKYADYISKYGAILFKDHFCILKNFMDLDQYREVLSSCRIAIFNHQRQQAIANIIMMLYLGARVYLSETGENFRFFKNKGLYVYSFQKDFIKYKTKGLEVLEIDYNRKKIAQIWDTAQVEKYADEIIDLF